MNDNELYVPGVRIALHSSSLLLPGYDMLFSFSLFDSPLLSACAVDPKNELRNGIAGADLRTVAPDSGSGCRPNEGNKAVVAARSLLAGMADLTAVVKVRMAAWTPWKRIGDVGSVE